MMIADKGRYRKEIIKQLSVLEEIHDSFREQKAFCFHMILEEFGITSGNVYYFIGPFKIKLGDHKEYTIKSVSYGIGGYSYINCINGDGNECTIHPYCLNDYEDYENVFREVYNHLKSEFHSVIPTDEFALSTIKYLEQECNWANENKLSLEVFGKRMQAHTIDSYNNLFDFKIGAFVFSISNVNGKYVVDNSYDVYNGKNLFVSADTISSLKARNGIQD